MVVLLVVEFAYDPDTRGSNAQTPLHQACAQGHTKLVRTLLKQLKSDLWACDADGNTPFFVAVLHSQVEVVELLITEFGCSPLMHGAGGLNWICGF